MLDPRATCDELKHLTVAVCLVLAASSTARSQTPGSASPDARPDPASVRTSDEVSALPADPDLGDYLAFAARHHPGLEAAYRRWAAAEQMEPQASALPDPKLSYAYFVENVETRVGPQRQKLGVSQGIPWLSKLRLRGDMASEAAHAAEQQYETSKRRVFYEVKDAYFELYYVGRALAITRDNLALMEHLEGVAQARFRGGAAVSGVIKAQLELGRLDDRRRSLEAVRDPVVARLNAALGRAADAPVPWPRELPVRHVEIDDAEIADVMADENPELRRLDIERVRDELGVELARKGYRPDFAVGLDWVDTGPALMPGLADSGKDPLMAMVSVTVPVWRSKLRAGVRQAEEQRRATVARRSDVENSLEQRLELALFRYRDAERKIDLYRDTLIPLAEASLDVAQEGYESAKVGFLDVIDAQRLLLELQLAFERSLTDHEQRLAEIEMLAGRSLTLAEAPDPRPTPGDRP